MRRRALADILYEPCEEIIQPHHLMLVDLFKPSIVEEREDVIRIYDHINLGLALINNSFRTFSLNIYGDLAALHKEARQISDEIRKQDNRKDRIPLYLFLSNKYKEIGKKCEELKQIKFFLNPDNLKTFDAIKAAELRFTHLHVQQLVVLSEIIAFTKSELRTRMASLEKLNPPANRNDLLQLNKIHAQLSMLSLGIIDSMKKRLEIDDDNIKKAEKIDIDIVSSNMDQPSELLTSWLVTAEPIHSQTTHQAMPELLISNSQDNFRSIRDYILYFIFQHGIESDQDWARNQYGFNEHSSYLKQLSSPVITYFHPSNNPYVGIVNDALIFSWENFGRNLWEAAQNQVNSMRGNRVAIKINQLLDGIEGNENYQQIISGLSNKQSAVMAYFNAVTQWLKNPGAPLPHAPEDICTISDDVSMDTNQQILFEKIEKMLENLEKEFKNLEREYNQQEQHKSSVYSYWPSFFNFGMPKLSIGFRESAVYLQSFLVAQMEPEEIEMKELQSQNEVCTDTAKEKPAKRMN